MTREDSLRLELLTERHNHQMDNERFVAEIERLKASEKALCGDVAEYEAENERLREALAKIEEETERTCRQCCMIENIARAALKPKP